MPGGRYIGIGILVFALTIAVLPQFNNCFYEGRSLTLANGTTLPMKCLWTARAELATGIPLLALGSMMVISRRRETVRNLGVVGLALGVLAILLPTNLIGVCDSEMACRIVMRPAMIFSGTAVTVLSLLTLTIYRRGEG